jgi:hypothetical protein
MREKGVDASDGLLRVLGVYFIFGLAILFRDGEDAQGLKGFEWVGGFRVEHADADIKGVTAKNECQYRQGGDQDSLD